MKIGWVRLFFEILGASALVLVSICLLLCGRHVVSANPSPSTTYIFGAYFLGAGLSFTSIVNIVRVCLIATHRPNSKEEKDPIF